MRNPRRDEGPQALDVLILLAYYYVTGRKSPSTHFLMECRAGLVEYPLIFMRWTFKFHHMPSGVDSGHAEAQAAAGLASGLRLFELVRVGSGCGPARRFVLDLDGLS